MKILLDIDIDIDDWLDTVKRETGCPKVETVRRALRSEMRCWGEQRSEGKGPVGEDVIKMSLATTVADLGKGDPALVARMAPGAKMKVSVGRPGANLELAPVDLSGMMTAVEEERSVPVHQPEPAWKKNLPVVEESETEKKSSVASGEYIQDDDLPGDFGGPTYDRTFGGEEVAAPRPAKSKKGLSAKVREGLK